MATYVQFKDGVAHAHVTTDGVLDDSSFIEVECSGHQHLGQTWTGSEWVDAKPIRYAIIDDRNTIVQINTTFYASEVNGKILEDDAIQINWTFDGEKFNQPIDNAAYIQAINAAKEATWAQHLIDKDKEATNEINEAIKNDGVQLVHENNTPIAESPTT